jgi:GNAT superfamily N-acetyltransferase
LLGIVTAVEDGPFAGNEHYLVELDGGMGGGEYSSSELMATTEKTAVRKTVASIDESRISWRFGGDSPGRGEYKGWYAIYVDEQKAGYVDWGVWDLEPNILTIHMIEVEPEFRRQGLASRMISHLIEEQYTRWGKEAPALTYGFLTDDGEAFGRSVSRGYKTVDPDDLAARSRYASKQSVELHVASDDYPVLEDILEERPPLENIQQRWASVETENFSEEVQSAPPVPADFSTYDKQDTDQRWADPQYYDKPYQSSLNEDLNEHVGFFRTKPGSGRSYDWCRFRRQQHCFFPRQLNEAATKIEGVPVWVPEDRGICGRHDWDEQRACPVSEPGPRSREAIYYSDATVPYEAGGQRRADAKAFHTNYKAPLVNFNLITNITTSMKDPDFSMHYTGAWVDVMNKARYLRQSGNVFIFSAPEQGTGNTDFVVGEVLGDSGIPYRVRLMREPGARRIAMWECGCAWGHYAWGRSGRWKKFEGRMCSHALSLLYEVQGREGFSGDRQIWENTEVPIWRDADEEPQERHPVDDYSYRDWRVGSLEMPEGTDFGMEREGNWRPVEWNDDFEHAPIVLMSAHEVMSAEANKNASKGGFPVKWRGQTEWVVQMDTDSSSVVLSNGVETNCYELLHPRYHPTIGLNVNESGDYEPMYKGAVLKDEPEPALPRTEGEEDDDFDPDDLFEYERDEKRDDDFLFEAEKPRPMEMLDTPDEPDDAPSPQEPEPAAPEVEEDEEPEDTIQLDAAALPRPEWLMSGGGSPKSSNRDGGISNSDIAVQARKVLAAKTFTPEEQAELIGEGEGTVAARNLDRLDIVGTHYEALERLGEEEEETYENLWEMLL